MPGLTKTTIDTTTPTHGCVLPLSTLLRTQWSFQLKPIVYAGPYLGVPPDYLLLRGFSGTNKLEFGCLSAERAALLSVCCCAGLWALLKQARAPAACAKLPNVPHFKGWWVFPPHGSPLPPSSLPICGYGRGTSGRAWYAGTSRCGNVMLGRRYTHKPSRRGP